MVVELNHEGLTVKPWKLAMLAMFGCALSTGGRVVFAQEDTGLFGTQSVVFKASGAGAAGAGCALIYKLVASDATYNNGKPALIAGNIGITHSQSVPLLTLKIGFAHLSNPNGRLAAPYFAYLQNAKATTRKSPYTVFADTGGLRVSLALDEAASSVVQEMLETGKVTMGFNPRKGAADLLLPIDLTVADTAMVSPKQYKRARSGEALLEFGNCYKAVRERAASGPPK